MELIRQAVPTASRVAVLVNPTGTGGFLKQVQAAAPALGVAVQAVEARRGQDLATAFAAINAKRAEVLVVEQDQVFFSNRTRIIDFAATNRLPAMYMYREWADAGGLMSYGADLREAYRRVATLVDRILKGAKPADLPVEQVTRLALVINLKTAKTLGLTIPPSLLLRVDKVIE